MKLVKKILSVAVACASTQVAAVDVTDAQDRVTIPDGDNLTITETGSLDTSGLGGASTARAFDSTIQFIDNRGSIFTGNDGITLFGTTVTGAITNSGSIANLDTVVSNGIRLDDSDGVPTLVQGGILNSGTIEMRATTCDNDTVCYGAGIAVLGLTEISAPAGVDGIANSGNITSFGADGAIDAGILIAAQANNDGSAPGADQSPNVNGILSNSGTILSAGTGIDIRGATVQSILNSEVTFPDGSVQRGLISASAGAGISITNTYLDDNFTVFGTFAGVTNVGSISNFGDIVGSDFGILISDTGTRVGNIFNEGSIRSIGPGNGAAIEVLNGAVLADITNSEGGFILGSLGPAIIIDNSTIESTISNLGQICSVDDAQVCRTTESSIIVRGSNVSSIFNDTNGLISGSSAIDVEDGSTINDISNFGTLTGIDLAVSVLSGSTVTNINNNGNGAVAVINGGIALLGNSSVTSINNAAGATINGGGLFGDGDAISVDASSLVNVSNSGTINGNVSFGDVAVPGQFFSTFNDGITNGNVDFGADGGTYIFGVGTHTGAILNASRVTAQFRTEQIGIGAHTSTLVGNLEGVPNFSVLVAGTDLGNGDSITDFGQLNVQGNVNIDNSLVDFFITAGEELIAVGEELPVLTATGTFSANGITTVDNSAILDFVLSEQTVGGMNSLVATVTTVGLQDFTDIAAEAGISTGNTGFNNIGNVFDVVAGDVADAIAAGDVAQDSELGQVFNELVGFAGGGVVSAIGTLDPETAEATFQAGQAADTTAAAVVSTRLSSLRGTASGIAAGDSMAVQGLWIQGYYNDTTQDFRDGVDGFEADTNGFAIGIDTYLSDAISAGIAISYANTGVDIQGAGFSDIDIDSLRLAIYGGYSAENYYIDTQLAYSMNDFDNTRNLFNGLVATSSHDGDQLSFRARAGYPISLKSGLQFTPRATLEYSLITEDSYAEEGAGNAGLQVNVSDVEVLLAKIGVRLAYQMESKSEIIWIPELTLDISHDFIGDEIILDSNFLGVSAAPFITQGANVEQTGYAVGLRMRAFGQGNFSFSGGYDYLYKEDYESQSLNVTVRYDF